MRELDPAFLFFSITPRHPPLLPSPFFPSLSDRRRNDENLSRSGRRKGSRCQTSRVAARDCVVYTWLSIEVGVKSIWVGEGTQRELGEHEMERRGGGRRSHSVCVLRVHRSLNLFLSTFLITFASQKNCLLSMLLTPFRIV